MRLRTLSFLVYYIQVSFKIFLKTHISKAALPVNVLLKAQAFQHVGKNRVNIVFDRLHLVVILKHCSHRRRIIPVIIIW